MQRKQMSSDGSGSSDAAEDQDGSASNILHVGPMHQWQSDNSALLSSHSGALSSATSTMTQPQQPSLSPMHAAQLQPQQQSHAATHAQFHPSPFMQQDHLNYTQQQMMELQQQPQPQPQPQSALPASSSAADPSALPHMQSAAHTLYNLGPSHFGVSVSGSTGTQLVQTLSSHAGPPSPEERREAAELGRMWTQDPASGQWSLWASSPSSSFSSQQAMHMHASSQHRVMQSAAADMHLQPQQQLDSPFNTLSNPVYCTHSISQLQGAQEHGAVDSMLLREQTMQQTQPQPQSQQQPSMQYLAHPSQQSIYNQELSPLFHPQEQMQLERGYQHSTPAQQLARCFPQPQQHMQHPQQQMQQQQLYPQSFSNPSHSQTFSQGGFGLVGENGPQSIDSSAPASSYSSAFGRRNTLARAPMGGNATRSQLASPMRPTFPMHGSSSSNQSVHPPLPWQQPAPLASPSGQGTVLVLTLIHPKYSDEPHRAHLIQLMRPKLINGHTHDELKQWEQASIDEHAIIEVPVPSVNEVVTLFRKHGRLLKIIVSFKAGLSRSLVQFESAASAISARSDYDGQEFRSATTGVNYGRMRVGPSNFTNLTVDAYQKARGQARDFTLEEECGDGMSGASSGMQDTSDGDLPADAAEPGRVLQIDGLPARANATFLKGLFSIYGIIRKIKMSFQTPGRALIEYSDALGVHNALQLFRDRAIFGARVHLSLSNFSHVHVSSHPAVRSSQQFSVDLDSSHEDPSTELKHAEDSPEARMSFSPMIPSRTLHARGVPAHIKLISIRNAIQVVVPSCRSLELSEVSNPPASAHDPPSKSVFIKFPSESAAVDALMLLNGMGVSNQTNGGNDKAHRLRMTFATTPNISPAPSSSSSAANNASAAAVGCVGGMQAATMFNIRR